MASPDGSMNGATIKALQAAAIGSSFALVGWGLLTISDNAQRIAVVEHVAEDAKDGLQARVDRLTRVEAKVDFLIEQVSELKRK